MTDIPGPGSKRIEYEGPAVPSAIPDGLLDALGWLIRDECEFVLRNYKQLLKANVITPVRTDHFWFSRWDPILAILNHSAVLSRTFWPASQTAAVKARGAFLRPLFNLSEPHPLDSCGRALRNDLEHWDERLDAGGWHEGWTKTMESETGYGLYIGPFDVLIDPASFPIRRYDPLTDMVAVGDSKLDLGELVRAVDVVANRAQQVIGYMSPPAPGQTRRKIWEHVPEDV